MLHVLDYFEIYMFFHLQIQISEPTFLLMEYYMFYYDIFLSMSNKNHYKKLYLSKGKIILTFIALFFILELLFYFVIQFQEVGAFFPFGISFYIYTPILILLTIIF